MPKLKTFKEPQDYKFGSVPHPPVTSTRISISAYILKKTIYYFPFSFSFSLFITTPNLSKYWIESGVAFIKKKNMINAL
jgi:hypothetical protein